jgi:hypothetical protein
MAESPRFALRMHAGARAPARDLAQFAMLQAGQDLRDERTLRAYQFGERDVKNAGIFLPSNLAGDARMGWARHRSLLWNLAEYAESGKNARVARGYTADLPSSLAPARRANATRDFAQKLANRFGAAVDFAVHGAHSQESNPHAHFLMTARELTPAGFGRVSSHGTRQETNEVSRMWLEELTRSVGTLHILFERFRDRSPEVVLEEARRIRNDWRQIRRDKISLMKFVKPTDRQRERPSDSGNDYGL